MNLNENIKRIREVMGLIVEQDSGNYDAILVGGLEHRQGDKSIGEQVQLLKAGNSSLSNVKGFSHNTSISEINKFLEQNPKLPVFLFSAGCDKAAELSSNPNVDNSKLYIIEPYAVSSNTKSRINTAVKNGVPESNVFVGPTTGRGMGIVSGASNSGAKSHWDALESVAQKVTISKNNTEPVSKNIGKPSKELMDVSYEYNPEVEKLQKELVSKGYYIGKFGRNKDGVDGKYGPFTKAAHEASLKGMNPKEFKDNRAEMAQEYIGEVEDATLKNEFNFHPIPLGTNNYRSAQIPVTIKGKDYLGEVIDKYGIKTIIRFNGDGNDSRHVSSHPMTSIEEEKQLADSKGVKFYKLSATRDQDKVNSLLSEGNVLIHCAHGADRTGGNVGGWLYKNGWGDTDKIWRYTTQYNGWNRMVRNNPKSFESGGYLKQAQKFGVKDMADAQRLAGAK